jgi:hypothetical protein
MVVRALAVITSTILVAGCESAAPMYIYSKPGATLEQMTRDEAECAGGTGGAQASPEGRRRCMTLRGYAAQELPQGSWLELREMKTTPMQNP